MKTLMTAALVAALACTGIGLSQEKQAPQAEPAKSADKKFTLDDMKQMLEAMGYTTEPWKDQNGKLFGYTIRYQSDNFNLICDIDISGNGQNIWLAGGFGKGIDGTVPADAVLKLLGLNDSIWPAYVNYSSKHKTFIVTVPTPTASVTPAALRTAINNYSAAMKAVIATWQKATEDAKTKTTTQQP